MLAPMQGITNRALRSVYGDRAKPDVLFTEFVRVRPKARQVIAKSDFIEATTRVAGIPLVVQVIGCADDGVVGAVQDLVDRGVEHINVNMGCPFGRMTSVLAGGGMFRYPETVYPMLAALREIVPGSLSVKTRLGIEQKREIFAVLDSFSRANIDFLIVHSRTVNQKYRGDADHVLSREIVETAAMPVIANGDIRSAADAKRVLKQTGAAGLMLGRGAVCDFKIFDRIRQKVTTDPTPQIRQQELTELYRSLLDGYQEIFHGDAQVLSKFREVLNQLDDPELARFKKQLRRAKTCDDLHRKLSSI